MKCSKCGKSILGKAYRTPLGDQVCRACSDRLDGLIIGGTIGGPGGAAGGPPLMKWVRNALGGGSK